ncbi:MAG: hypothetical protein WKF74_05525 [Pyrinomonadaceae bacterium]
MKALSLAFTAVLLCQSASLVFATPARQTNPQETLVRLTNKEVMEMVRSGLSADVIVAKIKRSRCNFDTFPGVLAEMKRNGVPETVILAMIEAPYGMPQQTPTPAAPPAEQSVARSPAPAPVVPIQPVTVNPSNTVPEYGDLSEIGEKNHVYVYTDDLNVRKVIVQELGKALV